ncbi:FG-GAP-like repeat-containing protein [Planctomycetota bacterium]
MKAISSISSVFSMILLFSSIAPAASSDSDSKPTHDVAITNVTVPSSCAKGDTVPVTISVANKGSYRETFRVTLADVNSGKEIAGKEVILAKGWKDGSVDVADQTFTCPDPGISNFGDQFAVGDVNNDGYDDLLVAAPRWNNNNFTGRVYLYYGDGASMENIPDKIFTGENIGDRFSDSGIKISDMNKDGYGDVLIGARAYNNITGRVYVYWGGNDMDVVPDKVIDGEESESQFGKSISVGDLNNDGDLDLVVGANRYDNYRGRVYLYYGPIASDTTVDKIFTGENINDTFGHQTSARGDVDGDGCDDILVGTMYYPRNTADGRAYLYYGDPGTTMDTTCDVYFDAENSRDEMGSFVDLFDIDNDGKAEVLITAREYGRSDGRAYLYWGKDRGSMNNTVDLCFEGEPGNRSSFGGESIWAGDVNKDGYGDIVVSAYNYPDKKQIGRSYLYYGNTKGVMDTVYDRTFDGEEADCNIQMTKTGDFNGDGFGDIVMAGWEYNNQQGRCWLFYGPFDATAEITFNWNTTNATPGKHILKASIAPVAGEEDVAANTMTVEVEVKER